MNPLEMFQFNADQVTNYDAQAKRYASLITSLLGCKTLTPPCGVNSTSSAWKTYEKTLAACTFFANNFTSASDCCSRASFPCNDTTYSLLNKCGCAYAGVGKYCCKQCALERYSTESAKISYNEGNLAYFSSRGTISRRSHQT